MILVDWLSALPETSLWNRAHPTPTRSVQEPPNL